MGRLLIIEDNNEINHLMTEWFVKNEYEVRSTFSGTEGLLYFQMELFDVIILDLMLPGMSGEEVLANIRKKSNVPVIVASAKASVDEKISLLEAGANDYVTKPFDLRELLARVRVQFNHKITNMDQDSKEDIVKIEQKIVCYKDLVINEALRTVCISGIEINLTRLEYAIVLEIFSHPQKIFSKDELFERAWDDYYEGADKTMNVHISNIRNKIKQITDEAYIDTIWGIGYRASKS